MRNTISVEDFKKLNKKKKKTKDSKKAKTRTGYDRLKDAVEFGFSFKKDLISISEDECIIKLEDISLLSHNDILRINFKILYTYISLWKERIASITSKLSEKEKETFHSSPVKIEFLLETNKSHTLDYDASIACIKFIVDGLVESKLLKDDTIQYIPLMLTEQIKDKSKPNSIYLIINKTSKEEIYKLYSPSFNKILNN
jgi:hypothetical protein